MTQSPGTAARHVPAAHGEAVAPSCNPSNTNVRAALKLLRYAENFPRDDDGVYCQLFGGGVFTDASRHPNIRNTRWGKTSTAAGAYQIKFDTWDEARRNGVVSDFTPASQDALAFSKLRSRHALQLVCDGNLQGAIGRLTTEWVSLPGGSQSHMGMEEAERRFRQYVAEYSR